MRTSSLLKLTVSLIAAVGAIANVVGMSQMNPPVKDLRESTLLFKRYALTSSTPNDTHSTK
jgi:hypothetical protein